MRVEIQGNYQRVRVRACYGTSVLGEASGQALPLSSPQAASTLEWTQWTTGEHAGTKDDGGLKLEEGK